MKPTDLKHAKLRSERQVLIQDRIWYVPNDAQQSGEFQFPGWNHEELFGNQRPVCVEYCSGNGAWIASRAAADPLTNWVAVERKFDRVRKIWSKLQNLRLNNLVIVYGEAEEVTARYFPEGSIEQIYINFPDPWPKNRHARHRLIQPRFIEQMGRVLKHGGETTFVTDDPNYSIWTIQKMRNSLQFVSSYPEPYFLTDCEDYGSSYFEKLWRDKGKVIRFHKFRRNG